MKAVKNMTVVWVVSVRSVMAFSFSLIGTPIASVASNYDYYDVRDYGASLNDGQDDSDAVQLAIDAAFSNGGGTVYFPAGVTTLAKPVNRSGRIGECGFKS